MAFLKIGGVEVKTPSSFVVGIQDISNPDSGRTLDGIMHKNMLTSKVTIAMEWYNTTPAETAAILNAFEANEYFSVTYWDPRNATSQVTKTFYLGDREAPVKQWYSGGERYETVSFTIIER